jgi:hypothetical protein
MNIFFDHVDWNSSAGPHWFASKLAAAISKSLLGLVETGSRGTTND